MLTPKPEHSEQDSYADYDYQVDGDYQGEYQGYYGTDDNRSPFQTGGQNKKKLSAIAEKDERAGRCTSDTDPECENKECDDAFDQAIDEALCCNYDEFGKTIGEKIAKKTQHGGVIKSKLGCEIRAKVTIGLDGKAVTNVGATVVTEPDDDEDFFDDSAWTLIEHDRAPKSLMTTAFGLLSRVGSAGLLRK